jgi:hypothetical protein
MDARTGKDQGRRVFETPVRPVIGGILEASIPGLKQFTTVDFVRVPTPQ